MSGRDDESPLAAAFGRALQLKLGAVALGVAALGVGDLYRAVTSSVERADASLWTGLALTVGGTAVVGYLLFRAGRATR